MAFTVHFGFLPPNGVIAGVSHSPRFFSGAQFDADFGKVSGGTNGGAGRASAGLRLCGETKPLALNGPVQGERSGGQIGEGQVSWLSSGQQGLGDVRGEEGEFFVPEMLLAAKAMKEEMTVLKPHLVAKDVKPLGKMVLGTVKGDLHEIGKNLVGLMAEGGGIEVEDLGVDVPPERFAEAARGEGVQLVALSSLMTTTLPIVKSTIEALKEGGILDGARIIVGGAVVTDTFAQ